MQNLSNTRKVIWISLTLLLILAIHAHLVTYGTWNFSALELRSNSYDSLGDSLLKLEADVRPDTVNWEGVDINGKKFMYWGLFPAIPRIFLNYFWPENWGKWARLTCLAASLTALLAWIAIINHSLKKTRDDGTAHTGGGLPSLYLLAFGLGSPIAYLVCSGRIYHEAIIWGMAASMWGVYYTLVLLDRSVSARFGILMLSLSAGIALLSRATFGLPLFVILGVLCLREIIDSFRGARGEAIPKILRMILWTLPGIVCILIQGWYNYKRYGSPLTMVDYGYADPDGSLQGAFNLKRIPVHFWNYFGFRSAYFIPIGPYIQMATLAYPNSPYFHSGYREQVISLSVSSCWLVFGAIVGSYFLIKSKNVWGILCYCALLIQVYLILSFFFATQRYATDLLPWLVFACSFSLPWISVGGSLRRSLTGLMILFSSCATIASTISWVVLYAAPDIDIPAAWQNRLLTLFSYEPQIPKSSAKKLYVDQLPVTMTHSFSAPLVTGTKELGVLNWGPWTYNH